MNFTFIRAENKTLPRGMPVKKTKFQTIIPSIIIRVNKPDMKHDR